MHDEQLFASMIAHGCPESKALEAVRFVPVAFARQFLDGLGVSFSDQYWRFSPEGEVVEQGDLESSEIYRQAKQLAPSLMSKPVISHVVFRSAEAHSVNDALNRGSKPTDLVLAPISFFSGQPTEAGSIKATEAIKVYLKRQREMPRKPWWKPW